MKKILGISLVALMSVTAANAEIASKGYVDSKDTAMGQRVGAVETLVGDTSVESQISTAVAAETSARESADTSLQSAINSINNESTGILAQAKGYTDTEIGDLGAYASVAAAIAGAVNTASSDNTTLAGRVTTAESDIDALEGRMDTAEGDIDALEGLVGDTAVSTQISSAITAANLSQYQTTANKVTTINAQSDDAHYPSAAAVYTAVQGANTATTAAIEALDTDGAQGTANQVIKTVTQTDGIVSVTSGEVTSAEIANGTIVNDDIASTAAIAMSKIAMPETIADGTQERPYGTYSLTANISQSGIEYKWELIERANGQ